MKFKHILFDLDGTLTDPFSGITKSVRYSLKKFGIDSELEPLKRFIGPPLIDSYIEFFGFDREAAELAVRYYREYYTADGMFDNRVYDGIPELLDKLKADGHELILATSKPIVFANMIMERFDLAKYFDFCFGCELDGRRTKKGEVIAWALENHPIDTSRAIMVGDRLHDVAGAHENKLPCAGILWGYGDREELEAAGADFIVSDIDELRELLAE